MRSVMKLQRTFSCITGVLIAVGFVASQASAGPEPAVCDFVIEINSIRGGSPTVTVNSFKDITAKARIAKGTAAEGTTIDTQLRIVATDGTQMIDSKTASPIRLGVGKGGQGAKLRMFVSQCNSGSIAFTATFFGLDNDGDECTASRRIVKVCK